VHNNNNASTRPGKAPVPLIGIFRLGNDVLVELYEPPAGWDQRDYVELIGDLVHNIAAAFHVAADDLWRLVERERRLPARCIVAASRSPKITDAL
jgi:hypothetical protein